MFDYFILFFKPDWRKTLATIILLFFSFILFFPAIVIGMLICLVPSFLLKELSCPCIYIPEEGPSLFCIILEAIVWYFIVCCGFYLYDIFKNKRKKSPLLTIFSMIIFGIAIVVMSYAFYVLLEDRLNPPKPKPYIHSPIRQSTSTQSKESTSTQPEEDTSIEEIDTSDWKIYRNEEYGFKIKYPPDYSVFKGETIEISRPLSKEGYSAGAKIYFEKNRVDFPAIGVSFPNILSLSFKDFAAYAAREHCFVKGTMGMTTCDKVLEETPFELPNGIKGYKIYLNLVSCGVERDEKGVIIREECSISKKGPIFALDVSEKTNNQLRGIFIEPFLLLSDLTKQQKGEEDTKRNLEWMISTVKFL